MTNTVFDMTHKSLVGATGLTISKAVASVNEFVGLLIGLATLVYLAVKIRLAIIDLRNKRKG